jgi:hypothetical protein
VVEAAQGSLEAQAVPTMQNSLAFAVVQYPRNPRNRWLKLLWFLCLFVAIYSRAFALLAVYLSKFSVDYFGCGYAALSPFVVKKSVPSVPSVVNPFFVSIRVFRG